MNEQILQTLIFISGVLLGVNATMSIAKALCLAFYSHGLGSELPEDIHNMCKLEYKDILRISPYSWRRWVVQSMRVTSLWHVTLAALLILFTNAVWIEGLIVYYSLSKLWLTVTRAALFYIVQKGESIEDRNHYYY